MAGELGWWEVSGTYAMALVAATSEDHALELMREHGRVTRAWGSPWFMAEPRPGLPGPPTAEGVYAVFV